MTQLVECLTHSGGSVSGCDSNDDSYDGDDGDGDGDDDGGGVDGDDDDDDDVVLALEKHTEGFSLGNWEPPAHESPLPVPMEPSELEAPGGVLPPRNC